MPQACLFSYGDSPPERDAPELLDPGCLVEWILTASIGHAEAHPDVAALALAKPGPCEPRISSTSPGSGSALMQCLRNSRGHFSRVDSRLLGRCCMWEGSCPNGTAHGLCKAPLLSALAHGFLPQPSGMMGGKGGKDNKRRGRGLRRRDASAIDSDGKVRVPRHPAPEGLAAAAGEARARIARPQDETL